MKKEIIRISEKDLHNIIKKTINELYYSAADIGTDYDDYDRNDTSIIDEIPDDELERMYYDDETDNSYNEDGSPWWYQGEEPDDLYNEQRKVVKKIT